MWLWVPGWWQLILWVFKVAASVDQACSYLPNRQIGQVSALGVFVTFLSLNNFCVVADLWGRASRVQGHQDAGKHMINIIHFTCQWF